MRPIAQPMKPFKARDHMPFSYRGELRSGQGGQEIFMKKADAMWRRFWGLMFAPALRSQPILQGLLITRCTSVHGCFMRQTIDVVYLSKAVEVAATLATPAPMAHRFIVTDIATLRPWRVSVGRSHTSVSSSGSRTLRPAHTLELPAGTARRLGLAPGDSLVVSP